MAPDGPRLLSGAMMVRQDGLVLLVQHPVASPFAGKWSMPLTGVPDHETAEDALERMLREALHARDVNLSGDLNKGVKVKITECCIFKTFP